MDTDELTPARKYEVTTARTKVVVLVCYSTDRSVVLVVEPVAAGE